MDKELEQPEVVAYLKENGSPIRERWAYLPDDGDAFRWAVHGAKPEPLMTVAQHEHIVAALQAEAGAAEWLRSTFKVHQAIVEQAGCETIEQLAEQRDALAAQLAELQGDALGLLIAAALYDFGGWLSTRNQRMTISATDNAGPVAEAIVEFCKLRGIDSEQDIPVLSWQDWLSVAPQPVAQEDKE